MHGLLVFKGKTSDFDMLWQPENYIKTVKGYEITAHKNVTNVPYLSCIQHMNIDAAMTELENEQ